MAYYDDFRNQLPDDTDSFPPYLFGLIDLLKKADEEIESLKSNAVSVQTQLEESKGKLEEAQLENLELLNKANTAEEAVEEAVEEEAIKEPDELLDGGLELTL